jgi:hypothetical protein
MGMPCEVNSILKLRADQGYPNQIALNKTFQAKKQGYRIFPIDLPICLVDENWEVNADIVIEKLTWESQSTSLDFRITRIYENPFRIK